MSRKIDEKKTKRALRRLDRARKAAEEAGTPDRELSEWEGEFLGSLEERLETYGSAFNDPDKGNTEDALSARQALKLREIEKKAKGKAASSSKSRCHAATVSGARLLHLCPVAVTFMMIWSPITVT